MSAASMAFLASRASAVVTAVLGSGGLRVARRRRIKKRFNARIMTSRIGALQTVGVGRAAARPLGTEDRPGRQLSSLTPRQVTRNVLTLDDGQQVGVAVAGAGIPFVLLHGIGFHNRTYEQCMSYLPEAGFLAVAIEAPGHGDTTPAARGADFATRVDLIRRAVDALGIRRAVMAGHSMGGRSAACFTALNPERVLAAVFIDAALGEAWDSALIQRLGNEVAVVRGLVDGFVDAVGTMRTVTWPERLAYYRMLSGPGRPHLGDLLRTPETVRAVAVAESDQWLAAIRAAAIPAVILHGARDLVIPWSDAQVAAERLDAPLLTVPGGYHSWLLASPHTFAATMAEIFEDRALMPRSAASCFDADALVLRWSPQTMEELSDTGRQWFAKAADKAAGWARSR